MNMKTNDELKMLVRQKYEEIANGETADCGCGPSSPEPSSPGPSSRGATSCCGPANTLSEQENNNLMIDMNLSYEGQAGYVAEADLGLGCGLPVEFAQIQPGDVVLDLGSGAGNDCFIARAETGETGRVIGLDMTPAMIDRARRNAKARGYRNVEFVYGDIEDMPLPDSLADVVVSNCVMNLVPDKARAFAETFRVLKPGGHFSISDIVLAGELPEGLRQDAELYAGCVSGAIQEADYLHIAEEAGFTNLTLQKRREIVLPEAVLEKYLTSDEISAYRSQGRGIFSITLYAEKPGQPLPKACCEAKAVQMLHSGEVEAGAACC